jgi:hypothetical protein
MIRARFSLLGLVLLVQSCFPSVEEPPTTGDQPSFFDLSDYMEAEMEKLQRLQPAVTKRVNLRGEEQVKSLDSLNYRQELKPFADSDINRPAWYDKYDADTTRAESGETYTVTYTCLADNLRVRELSVTFRSGSDKVLALRLSKRTDSLVEELKQELSYHPGEGYRMISEQHPLLGQGHRAEVEVRWAQKK